VYIYTEQSQLFSLILLKNLKTTQTFIFKGSDRSFELRGESRLIWSVYEKLKARQFFLFHFKGTPTQDQQKP